MSFQFCNFTSLISVNSKQFTLRNNAKCTESHGFWSDTSFFSLSLRLTEDSILHHSTTFRCRESDQAPSKKKKKETEATERKTVGEKNRLNVRSALCVCICAIAAVLVFNCPFSSVSLLFVSNDLSFACYGYQRMFHIRLLCEFMCMCVVFITCAIANSSASDRSKNGIKDAKE